MPLKICFHSQIHRVSNIPENFSSLLQLINTLFGNDLPQKFTLKYIDHDGDAIMLSNERDYTNLVEEDLCDLTRSVRVFITSLDEDLSIPQRLNNDDTPPISPRNESLEEEEFQIVDKSSSPGSEKHHNELLAPEPQEEPKEDMPAIKSDKLIEASNNEEAQPHEKEEERRVEETLNEEAPKQENHQKRDLKFRCKQLKKLLKELNRQNISQQKRERLEGKLKRMEELTDQKEKFEQKKKEYLDYFTEKKAMKKKVLKETITEVLNEQLPSFAALMKELVLSNKDIQPQPIQNIPTRPSEVKPIHILIQCDGCGIGPIHGIRYKCSVCPDFDYCEDCEARIDHAHPFIKIKKPEEIPFSSFCPFQNKEEPKSSASENLNDESKNQKEQKEKEGTFNLTGVSEELGKLCANLPQTVQKCAHEQYENLPSTFKQNINSLLFDFPEKFFAKLKNLTSNIHHTTSDVKEEVKIEEAPILENAQETTQTHLEENCQENAEGAKIQENKKEYPAEVQEKAQRLKEIFDEHDINQLLEFVFGNSELSLEDLIDKYLNLY